jgi:hypothetical protein
MIHQPHAHLVGRQKRAQAMPEQRLMKKLALPDDFDAKAQFPHLHFFATVAQFVLGDLLGPPLPISSRKTCEPATFMPVPETPMNENTPSPRLVRDVWTPRKVGRTDAEASPKAV